MNLDLTGKHALVMGASRGLGWASAVELAKLGADVTIASRSESDLEDRVRELSALTAGNHDQLVVDTMNTDALGAGVGLLCADRPVHILVNNTGGPPAGKIELAEPAAFEQAFTQHLIANHVLVQQVLPGMRAEGYGRIVNIVSTSVKQPIPGIGVSNTTRGAVASWAKTLANELAAEGITVNNVLPGATVTDRLAEIWQAQSAAKGITIEEAQEAMLADIPMGRFGQIEEFGAVVAFLCSPAASYITGVSLPVDGGKVRGL